MSVLLAFLVISTTAVVLIASLKPVMGRVNIHATF
ncbi:Protein of unknown function [Anaplasma phagocytophilum]|uniref:Uncharacterized protein n=1 Tax=Anaplasma phagocytophilum TaxID=948 RepID=A0A098EFX4_ANAPH|nr:Protein of unknown function [Anaplasma phagocytophilum]